MKYIAMVALAVFSPLAASAHPPGGGEAHPHENVIRQNPDFAVIDQPFVPTRSMLRSGESASGIVFHEFTLPPRTAGAPPHTHAEDEEFFYVVSGSLDVMSGDEVLRLEEGGFAALLPGRPHMFWNGSDAPVKAIMAAHGGHFEDFFDNVGAMLAEAQPASPEEAGPLIGAFAAERGITIDFSLMPEEAAPFYGP